ncbi:helix-turn-helix domain-containing protein [Paenibacillus tundrae]|uniref:Transcriptional regulator with XRE-family HTH domain n=1 Tax=Paenibacillus tundrae TaxID=528187 RepID=A0ABT9WGC1_9BACL|nr:helix-turn-helix transcriptional regulator [Paenibacillus tundrae]MDQ0172205.1 transcriptional regulator with XRE-family HTH domain [Paenibacillus tundrae]
MNNGVTLYALTVIRYRINITFIELFNGLHNIMGVRRVLLTSTIRSHIEGFIKQHGYKLQEFAKVCGVNVGTISAIINGSRPIAVNQLDLITSGMGLEKGYFYEMYTIEFFMKAAPDWRRLEPFLYRCAELDKLDCIEKVVIQVTEDRSYTSGLFKVAENMYDNGMKSASLILYECVAECEKYQHSERLALCQYRIFLLSCVCDQKASARAATRFEPFVDRLEEEYQLDALKDLGNLYLAIHDFERLYPLTVKLEKLSTVLQGQRFSNLNRKTTYPIFVYTGYSLLMRASCYSRASQYEEALKCTQTYYQLSVDNPTEEDMLYIEKFRKWGEMNTYLFKLMMGQNEVLQDYINHVEGEDEELVVALYNIVQTANRFRMDVNFVLDKYKTKLDHIHIGSNREYTTQSWGTILVKFLYEMALYHLSRSNYEAGMDALIRSIELSDYINNDSVLIKCVSLFGEYRAFASEETRRKYKLILKAKYML